MALLDRPARGVPRIHRVTDLMQTTTDKVAAFAPDVPQGSTVEAELEQCMRSFTYSLRYWRYRNREGGPIRSFAELWPGQAEVAALMERHSRLYLLKAGKLGFTELECAYDGWVLRFGPQNARVHAFSIGLEDAKQIVRIVKFGMLHLPEWMQLDLVKDNEQELHFQAGRDDTRVIRAYPSTEDASISESCTHAHVDEMARMPWPAETYSAAESTVPAHGSLHIVTRGKGAGNFAATKWEGTKEPNAVMVGCFIDFTGRPRQPVRPAPEGASQDELNERWYAEQADDLPTLHQLHMFAPRTAEEALSADAEEAFVLVEQWRRNFVPELPLLVPGDRMPGVLSLDAGVNNDYFAAALVTRNPDEARHDEAALRLWRVWKPPRVGVEIKYGPIEAWVRMILAGGCVLGHPNTTLTELSAHVDGETGEPCDACARGDRQPAYNIAQLTYDQYQLVDMAQRIRRDGLIWVKKFSQGGERLEADTALKKDISNGRLAHGPLPPGVLVDEMETHLTNARMKVPKGEDTRARMEKSAPGAKIDLGVALSMGRHRVLKLDL